MNRFIKYICFGFVGPLLLFSCKKNNLVIDKDVIPPAFAKFNTIADADTVRTYYVRSTNDPYKIPVGINTVSDKDRTVQFSYTSNTAVQGTQYNGPASIVIPAGKTIDSLSIGGLFSGYPSSDRKDTLNIKITGGDVPANFYKSNFRLVLRKYCDVILSDLTGDYNTMDGSYGPYPTSISDPVSTGPNSGTVIISNVWDPGVPVTTLVNLNWADPANFTVTIPDQEFFGPADIWIRGTTPGIFSSCDQSFTLRYTLYYKSDGEIFAANQVSVLTR